jgi:hypothetical protein
MRAVNPLKKANLMIRFIIILGCAAALLATFNLILIGKYLYCIISYILGALLWSIFVGSGPYGGLFVKGRPWALYLFWPLEALFRIYQRYWLLYKNPERFMVSYKTYDRNDREYLNLKIWMRLLILQEIRLWRLEINLF